MRYIFFILLSYLHVLANHRIPVRGGIYSYDDIVICDIPTNQLNFFYKKGFFTTESLYKEGFIHCAKPRQLPYVINKYFTENSYALFISHRSILGDALVYEGKDPNNLYPHLRRPFFAKDVMKIFILNRNSLGLFEIPKELSL